jgi:putative nucleotidyltransferase with HDIG domain
MKARESLSLEQLLVLLQKIRSAPGVDRPDIDEPEAEEIMVDGDAFDRLRRWVADGAIPGEDVIKLGLVKDSPEQGESATQPLKLTERDRLVVLMEAGKVLASMYDWDRSIDCYREALEICERLEDTEAKAEASKQIGRLYRRKNQWKEALGAYEKSLEMYRALGDLEGVAQIHNSLGIIYFENGKWDEAKERYHEALEVAEELSNFLLIAKINNNLGALANAMGDWDRAVIHYQESVPGFEKAGDLKGLAETYHNLGMTFADQGNLEKAAEYYERSLDLSKELGDQRLMSGTFINRAHLFAREGNYDKAKEYCDRALAMLDRLGDKLGIAEVYKLYGMLHREREEWESAEHLLLQSIALGEKILNPLGVAEACHELGLVYERMGEGKKTLKLLTKSLDIFKELRARRSILQLNRELTEVEKLYLRILESMGAAVEAKDPYTHGHSRRVANYSLELASRFEVSEEEAKGILSAAYLHDVGKVYIDETILIKPTRLTDDEYELIKQHPRLGLRMLESVEFPWTVKPLILHHHEHFDGSGYPDGLSGNDIPWGARLIFVADFFDAMTSDRPYRAAWAVEETIKVILHNRGTLFDPEIADVFIDLVKSEAAPIQEDIACRFERVKSALESGRTAASEVEVRS